MVPPPSESVVGSTPSEEIDPTTSLTASQDAMIGQLSPTGALVYNLGSASWAFASAIASTVASMTQSECRAMARPRSARAPRTRRTSRYDAAQCHRECWQRGFKMNPQSSSESAIYSPPFCQQVRGADECRPDRHRSQCKAADLLSHFGSPTSSTSFARFRAAQAGPGRTARHIGVDQILEQLIQLLDHLPTRDPTEPP